MSFWDDESDKEEVENIKKNPFAKGRTYDFSDSSEDEKRKVKTPKEKLQDQINKLYNEIRDDTSNKVMTELSQSYDDLIKIYSKVKSTFDTIPMKYIKSFFLLDSMINSMSKEDKDQLTQHQFKSFNALKKKFYKDFSTFEAELNDYKENRKEDEDENEEEDDKLSDLSDLTEQQDKISDESDDDQIKNDNADDPAIRRLKWVKKDIPSKKDKDKDNKEIKNKDKDLETGGKGGKGKKTKETEDVKVQIITDIDIEKELNDISKIKGHAQSKPTEMITRLENLIENARNKILKIKLYNVYVSVTFDTAPGHFSYLSNETWRKLVKIIRDINNIFIEESQSDEKNEDMVHFINLD